MVSDLDKATIELKDLLIMPRTDDILEKVLGDFTNTIYSKVYEFRYNCYRNTNLCNRFKPYQYDIITLLYDIYLLLYINVYKKSDKISLNTYYKKLDVLNKFVMELLDLNKNEFKIFYRRINQKLLMPTNNNITLGIHINSMLYYFCSKLKKKKN